MSCVPLELQWDYGTLKKAWFNIVDYVNNSVSTPLAIQKLLKLETCKWVSKCSKQAMAHVGSRDISRSKMSVKWDTSVGELVQVLAYDSIVESLQFIRSTPVEKVVLFSTKLALHKKNISVHKNAHSPTGM